MGKFVQFRRFWQSKTINDRNVSVFKNVIKNGNILNIYGPLYIAADVHIKRKVILLECDVHHFSTIDLIEVDNTV